MGQIVPLIKRIQYFDNVFLLEYTLRDHKYTKFGFTVSRLGEDSTTFCSYILLEFSVVANYFFCPLIWNYLKINCPFWRSDLDWNKYPPFLNCISYKKLRREREICLTYNTLILKKFQSPTVHLFSVDKLRGHFSRFFSSNLENWVFSRPFQSVSTSLSTISIQIREQYCPSYSWVNLIRTNHNWYHQQFLRRYSLQYLEWKETKEEYTLVKTVRIHEIRPN